VSQRDERGRLLPGSNLAQGVHTPRPRIAMRKAYTDAVRQLLDTPVDQVHPDGWPEKRKDWTNAQELAERHLVMARSGDMAVAHLIIERAEGKLPTAPEDREGMVGALGALVSGMTALNRLRMALGMPTEEEPLDAEIVLPEHPEHHSLPPVKT
jgi:hypothetical protein